MAQEQRAIDISDLPALRDIVREVSRTQQRRAITVQNEDVTLVVVPNHRKRPRTLRGKPTSADDPLWKIIGIGKDEQATDVSEHHDRYLADAYADTHE